MKSLKTIFSILILLLVAACRTTHSADGGGEDVVVAADSLAAPQRELVRHFTTSFNPARISSREEYVAAIASYWDEFPFDADTLLSRYDTLSLVMGFADYVTFIEPQSADSLLRALIHRAEASRAVLDLFAEVSGMVLHDPNSPLRNDEYYIPILETLVSSPLYDEYDRIAYEFDLDVARKNRVGELANDFTYTLADGSRHRMHDIEAEYLLILFSNPGCPMCRELTAAILSSPMLNELCEMGLMRVVSLYPDRDVVAWRDYLRNMPSSWINGYDAELQITSQRLYDLRAIPSLYLLDSEKRVLIKDGFDVAAVEYCVSR